MMIRKWLVPPQIQYLARGLRGGIRRAQLSRFYRETLGWLLPAGLQSILLRVRAARHGIPLARNRTLAGQHSGRCWVIGNGPSLADVDLRLLENEFTICANSIYKHPHAREMGVDFLCIGDQSFMEDTPKNVLWHRTIAEQLPSAKLMLHADGKRLRDNYDLYPNHDVYYFARGITHNIPDLVTFDFTRPIDVGNTTGTMLSIPLAIFLGFTEINLVGFDANWLDNYSQSYHFYERHELYPEFDSAAADNRWTLYEDMLAVILREFESHRIIAARARQLGVSIRNATRGGRLEMYQRIRFEDCVVGSSPNSL